MQLYLANSKVLINILVFKKREIQGVAENCKGFELGKTTITRRLLPWQRSILHDQGKTVILRVLPHIIKQLSPLIPESDCH